MEFEERYAYEVKAIPIKVFVYFLLDDLEVVYVGKTKAGLTRPFAHTDKKFDSVIVYACDEQDLTLTEEKFIMKYKPKYNNYIRQYVTLQCCKNKLKEIYYCSNLSIIQIKKAVKYLGIEYALVNGNCNLSFEDYDKIKDLYIKRTEDFCKGRLLNEL